MAIEIVDFPIKNGGSFHGKMLVHQRVYRIDLTNEKCACMLIMATCRKIGISKYIDKKTGAKQRYDMGVSIFRGDTQ